MTAKRFSVATAATAATVAVATASAVPAQAHFRPRVVEAKGPAYIYESKYSPVRTKVFAITTKKGTKVVLRAAGFPKSATGKTFGAHVHAKPCGPNPVDAGPHYQSPYAPKDAPLAVKEIWLDITINHKGKGVADQYHDWRIPKGKAGSVVIHAEPTDPRTGDAGARLICTNVPFGT